MDTRRTAREWVLQLLFQQDMNPRELPALFDEFWKEHATDAETREFTESLVEAVGRNRMAIDMALSEAADNWRVGRMGVVERSVLRMAAAEMLYRDDIPPVVSINEAVDLAKYFSKRESGRFVNGILDRVRKGLQRPAAEAAIEGQAES